MYTNWTPGGFTIEDVAKPGAVRQGKKGDIFYASKGTTVKWGSPTGSKGVFYRSFQVAGSLTPVRWVAFYVIQLPGGVDPTPYFSQCSCARCHAAKKLFGDLVSAGTVVFCWRVVAECYSGFCVRGQGRFPIPSSASELG
jgi:hypothetical protein